jgi:two-component system, NtrC family, sensor kinase
MLEEVIAFSRDATAELSEEALLRAALRTLRRLLPGRLVAVSSSGASPGTLSPLLPEDEPLDLASAPLVFRAAAAGFSVPLRASEHHFGEVHVNYRPRAPRARTALEQDRAVVLPIADHVSAVMRTRRLLWETAHLQASLTELIEQANLLILAADSRGRVIVWNRALHQLTGYASAEAAGRELLPWLRELGRPELAVAMKKVLDDGQSLHRELPLPTRSGAPLRAAVNVVAVRAHDGSVTAALAIGQDVTALQHLQSQIIHAEKLATVGQIAAGVAHEINNPLTSIQVCAETLLRKISLATQGRGPATLDVADGDRLRKIKEGAERIRRFARDLVTYARPSGAEVEEISLNEVIEQGLSFCEHVLEEARATVERDLAAELPRIAAVRDQILQVVINLVTNAAHAVAGRGGTLRLRSWSDGRGTVGFAVRDDGLGIKPEDAGKIFEPFFTTKPAGRGTGLGLSVVRNIVFAHGGGITFEGAPGGGTTFSVTLPIAPPESSLAQGQGAASLYEA